MKTKVQEEIEQIHRILITEISVRKIVTNSSGMELYL